VLEILAGDHRQFGWDLTRVEPSNTGTFVRLPDDRFTRCNAADERGRHPVLALVREDMIHDVEQLTDLDLDPVFLAYLPSQRIGQPLAQLH